MKIQELLEAKKFKKHLKKHHDIEDKDEPVADADDDKTPLITMQLLKSLDVDGNYPVAFKDGKKFKLHLNDVKNFLQAYMMARPDDKEAMQDMASQSLEMFHKALSRYNVPPQKPASKIKGDRYMSHFRGDFDDK